MSAQVTTRQSDLKDRLLFESMLADLSSRFVKLEAAELLGLKPMTLRSRTQRLGLDPQLLRDERSSF